MDLTFRYGQGTLPVHLPDEWIGETVRPQPVTPLADVESAIRQALDHPVGAPPLKEFARSGHRIAILVDDFTRKTPIQLMLPPVLGRLRAAGVSADDIDIVIASGTHRPMSRAEILDKLGGPLVRDYRVRCTAETPEGEFVSLGTSRDGIPAFVDPVVARADVRIGLGEITPHLDAGFSGGSKIVLPGVCGPRTVDAFHFHSAYQSSNPLGNPDAPLRLMLERLVADSAPLHFILNVILTPAEEVYRFVAGDPHAAHRAGVAHARAAFGAPAARRYSLVVANCYPYDFDLWQSIKGIWAGDLLTQDGGTLIAVTAAPEGHSNYPLVPAYAGMELDALERALQMREGQDDKQVATGYMFRRLQQRIRLVLVSTGLTESELVPMRVQRYATVESAVMAELERLPAASRQRSIALVPEAGVALPLLVA